MDESMKQGIINCNCNNVFYFKSSKNKIQCIVCGMMHPNNGEPVLEEPPTEEGDPYGTDN